MTAGYLPQADLGEYAVAADGLGALPRMAFAEPYPEQFGLETLPHLFLGQGDPGVVALEHGALGALAFAEEVTYPPAALPLLDLGEYPYVSFRAPRGEVLPDFVGRQYTVVQTPTYSTNRPRGDSLREASVSFMPNPLWKIRLGYEVLREYGAYAEYRTFMGFVQARRVGFNSFLFINPRDSAVEGQQFGVGDGVTKEFQLVRTYGAGGFLYDEPVQNLALLISVEIDGVSTQLSGAHPPATPLDNSVMVSKTGMAVFAHAPGEGLPLTWSGSYYYRCVFAENEMPSSQFNPDMWSANEVLLHGSPANMV